MDPAATWRTIAAAIENADAPVDFSDLTDAEAPRSLIPRRSWAAVEVVNTLRHIEVLLGAIELLAIGSDGSPATRFLSCSPAQQSISEPEHEGGPAEQSADLEGEHRGERFVLEAYGGVHYRSNSKLALDLRALLRTGATRCFLAARRTAFDTRPRAGKPLRASAASRQGGPFSVIALWGEVLTDDHYVVAEVTKLRVRP